VYYINVLIVNYETGRDKYDTRAWVIERQKRRKKCKSAAIMAETLTQHECMPGHPDNWEYKVKEHT
jgi:hypothetical protein